MASELDADARQAPPPHGARRRAALAFVFVTVFLDMLALGIITPILPKLILSMCRGDIGSAAEYVGVFATAFALMQFLFAVAQGALSDRFGRRPVILASNFGLGFDYVVMALAPSLGWLMAGRVVSGICAASVMTSYTYVTDITQPERRAQAYGLLGVAVGLGGMAGPALGGVLGDIDLRLPFWAAAMLSVANGLYGLMVIPESLPPAHRARLTWARFNPLGGIKVMRYRRGLGRLATVNLLAGLAAVAMPATFVLYTGWRYGWNARDAGLALAALGLGGLVVQGWLVGIASKRLSERWVLLIGLACNAAGFAILGLAQNGNMVWASLPLLALGGLMGPSSLSLITRLVGPNDQGHTVGAISSLLGIANLIGPLIFSTIFAAAVGSMAEWGLPGASFLLATMCLAVAALLV